MIKQLTSKKNLNAAYRQVYCNKGAAGVDEIQVIELKSILQTHGKQYTDQIERESYQVSPILGVEIPKSNGKKRLLGIPTVVDRVFNKHCNKLCNLYLSQAFRSIVMGSGQTATPIRPCHRALKILTPVIST